MAEVPLALERRVSQPQQPGQQVLRVRCPNLMCQRILAVPVLARGKLVRCRNCGMTIRIPKKSDGDPAAPAAAPKAPGE